MNILFINGHQRYEGYADGKLNQTVIDTAAAKFKALGHSIDTTIVEAGYDVTEELNKHQWADILFVQFPVYWMGVPYIFKKYIDEVYTAGIGSVVCTDDGRTRSDLSKKYGSGGLMGDKKYILSSTWNAPEEAFIEPGQFFEGKGVDGAFMWLHKVYQFFGMQPLESFSCFDVLKNPKIEDDLKRLEEYLEAEFSQ